MIELLTSEEMAEADRLAIAAGRTGASLMEKAGLAVADCLSRQHALGATVIVIAGPGNNGGDGFVAARVLADRGFKVRVLLLGERERLKSDAAGAAQRWTGAVEKAHPGALCEGEIFIDALFGAGLDRDVTGPAADLIEAMNASGRPIVAVDLPSGINGATGAVMSHAVRATETVTFFRRKPGHVLLPGRLNCGKVRLADIGIPATVLDQIRPLACLNEPPLWRAAFPLPKIDAHKYARGHAVVVSGAMPRTGAARLAARGALRAGAGLVTIASPRDALSVHAATNDAVMVRAVDDASELSALLNDRRFNAVLLGPAGGIGQPMRDLVLAALAGERAVVLDADALTSFSDYPASLFGGIESRSGPVVLTPHEGEFARLFGALSPESKLERARSAARASGATVLLKGPDTVVAAADGRASIAANAPPWLATAGSGDVLSGFVAGLLAQGMPPFEAASAAVWLHGEAANEAGPGLISEDLAEALPAVYRKLFAEMQAG